MSAPVKDKGFFLNWPVQAGRFLRCYDKLLSFKIINNPDKVSLAKSPVLFAIWHEVALTVLARFGHYGYHILSSLSRDGEYITKGAEYLGFRAIRGSSSRGGGEALLASLKSMKNGDSVIYTVDGPRGPRRVAKPGIALVAAKTGYPFYPVGVAAHKKLVIKKSWDKHFIPLPFSKVVVYFDNPIFLPPEAASWPKEKLSEAVTNGLDEALLKAEATMAEWLGKSA